jgi:hypothetical protein
MATTTPVIVPQAYKDLFQGASQKDAQSVVSLTNALNAGKALSDPAVQKYFTTLPANLQKAATQLASLSTADRKGYQGVAITTRDAAEKAGTNAGLIAAEQNIYGNSTDSIAFQQLKNLYSNPSNSAAGVTNISNFGSQPKNLQALDLSIKNAMETGYYNTLLLEGKDAANAKYITNRTTTLKDLISQYTSGKLAPVMSIALDPNNQLNKIQSAATAFNAITPDEINKLLTTPQLNNLDKVGTTKGTVAYDALSALDYYKTTSGLQKEKTDFDNALKAQDSYVLQTPAVHIPNTTPIVPDPNSPISKEAVKANTALALAQTELDNIGKAGVTAAPNSLLDTIDRLQTTADAANAKLSAENQRIALAESERQAGLVNDAKKLAEYNLSLNQPSYAGVAKALDTGETFSGGKLHMKSDPTTGVVGYEYDTQQGPNLAYGYLGTNTPVTKTNATPLTPLVEYKTLPDKIPIYGSATGLQAKLIIDAGGDPNHVVIGYENNPLASEGNTSIVNSATALQQQLFNQAEQALFNGGIKNPNPPTYGPGSYEWAVNNNLPFTPAPYIAPTGRPTYSFGDNGSVTITNPLPTQADITKAIDQTKAVNETKANNAADITATNTANNTALTQAELDRQKAAADKNQTDLDKLNQQLSDANSALNKTIADNATGTSGLTQAQKDAKAAQEAQDKIDQAKRDKVEADRLQGIKDANAKAAQQAADQKQQEADAKAAQEAEQKRQDEALAAQTLAIRNARLANQNQLFSWDEYYAAQGMQADSAAQAQEILGTQQAIGRQKDAISQAAYDARYGQAGNVATAGAAGAAGAKQALERASGKSPEAAAAQQAAASAPINLPRQGDQPGSRFGQVGRPKFGGSNDAVLGSFLPSIQGLSFGGS